MNLYEGMFLLNSVEAKRDWEGLSGYVKDTLTKRGAEILKEEHWEDRKLAYEIAGQKRGTYLLIFFKFDPLGIAALRREFQLSEQTLRQLFIRHAGDEVPAYASPGKEYSSQRGFGPRRSAGPARDATRRPAVAPAEKAAKPVDSVSDVKPGSETDVKADSEDKATS